jgi:hypothetical protein
MFDMGGGSRHFDGLQLDNFRVAEQPEAIRANPLSDEGMSEIPARYRQVTFPYTMLELLLEQERQRTGTAIGAAKIRFDREKNVYEIESFKHGAAYNKLLNVQLMK